MPTNTITVTYGIETPMRDGVVLRSTVYRPNDAEPHPALLTRTPYGRDLGVNSAWFNPPTVAAAGFAVVLQDCRGRFGSDGDFFPSVNEADGGEDTIGWLRRQPWCDGSVGMWGRSYVAETQWRAALRRPDGLKALALGVSAGGNANDGAIIRGGVVELGSRIGWGHASASMDALTRRHRGDPSGLRDALDRFDRTDGGLLDGMLLATRPLRDLARIVDPFIAEHLVPSLGAFPGGVPSPLWDEPMEGCPAPHATLHIGGLYDIFLPTTLDQYRRQLEFWRHGGCPRPRLILGPWTHSGYGGVYDGIAMGATSGASAVSRFGDLSSMHAAWFADVLAGRDADTAALAAVPPALVFVMGENRWRGFDELPVSTPRRLYPHTEGLASWEPCGPGVATLTSDPADPVPMEMTV
jgi:uncharacterized protein